MGRIFAILAFVTVMGLAIPAVNAVSPFSSTYKQNANTNLNQKYIAGLAGCTTVNLATGAQSCNATVSGSTGSGFLGAIANTIFVFGNFFAALGFLANMAVGVAVPGQYVYTWLFAVFGASTEALAIAAVFQSMVTVAYANEFFYIVSGRWIFPP